MATYSSKKYPSGSVTSAQLADGTVVAVDLADGAVTSAKLNSTVDLSGKTVTYRSIVAGDIASDAITTAKLQQMQSLQPKWRTLAQSWVCVIVSLMVRWLLTSVTLDRQ
jgi:hypothetical protein